MRFLKKRRWARLISFCVCRENIPASDFECGLSTDAEFQDPRPPLTACGDGRILRGTNVLFHTRRARGTVLLCLGDNGPERPGRFSHSCKLQICMADALRPVCSSLFNFRQGVCF
jgi:hypothetical protein